MKTPKVNLLKWHQQYGTEKACINALIRYHWPNGFICPACSCSKAYFLTKRKLYQCAACKHQVSITAGTIFHSTKLPLVSWFLGIYLVAADKGSVSALRLSKHLDIAWKTAWRMLQKIRIAMADRDSLYRLQGIIELDDAYIGGKHSGKRGRGAKGKTPILVAVEYRDPKAGFVAMKVVPTISSKSVEKFVENSVRHDQFTRTDAYPAMNVVKKTQNHLAQAMKESDPNKWLKLVHIVIGNLKIFLNGTFHGVSNKYLQSYLDEFCYRFNRRFWEFELPYRLLVACLEHVPIRQAENC